MTAARQLGVDAVLFGEIPEFTAQKDSAALRLELRMAERDSGQAVFVRSYSSSRADTLRARIADSSKGRRIFIWVLFTILLPLVTVPLIRRLIAVDSNLMNLGLLARVHPAGHVRCSPADRLLDPDNVDCRHPAARAGRLRLLQLSHRKFH